MATCPSVKAEFLTVVQRLTESELCIHSDLDFLQGAIDGGKGFAREDWIGAGNPYSRKEYDSMLDFLERLGLIKDRQDGVTGKCTVDSAREACERLHFRWD